MRNFARFLIVTAGVLLSGFAFAQVKRATVDKSLVVQSHRVTNLLLNLDKGGYPKSVSKLIYITGQGAAPFMRGAAMLPMSDVRATPEDLTVKLGGDWVRMRSSSSPSGASSSFQVDGVKAGNSYAFGVAQTDSKNVTLEKAIVLRGITATRGGTLTRKLQKDEVGNIHVTTEREFKRNAHTVRTIKQTYTIGADGEIKRGTLEKTYK
jgi:hypothetical protein